LPGSSVPNLKVSGNHFSYLLGLPSSIYSPQDVAEPTTTDALATGFTGQTRREQPRIIPLPFFLTVAYVSILSISTLMQPYFLTCSIVLNDIDVGKRIGCKYASTEHLYISESWLGFEFTAKRLFQDHIKLH
jgi:hypothetical protein